MDLNVKASEVDTFGVDSFYVRAAAALLIVFAFQLADASGQSNQPSDDFDAEHSNGLTRDQIEEGWLALFDGNSLYGWKAESKADWQVSDREIRVTSGEMGLLRTTSQFDDFELSLEFKAGPKTNSGIFVRTSPKPKDPADDCLEINIAPADNPFPTGSLVYRHKSDVEVAGDAWHRYRIVVQGEKLKVWLDEKPTIDFKLKTGDVGRGFIGLQVREGAIAFRNIYLKPLSTETLFDGKSLDGWDVRETQESELSVTAKKELRIQSGKGQIATKQKFGDFVFSTHCKTNAAGLNSGVFFRSIPGDVMNGYESQIQNEFKDGDPTKPVDCGTGGIFRRKPARRVNAADNRWFAKTIVATGPHVAVWINGLQVVDWTDKRKPHANPRKGLRLEPGTIIFQGHDPTTDLLFKNIFAKEQLKRRLK